MEKSNYDKLYSLAMFESVGTVHSATHKEVYTRVPGGWVRDLFVGNYVIKWGTSVFIPFVDKVDNKTCTGPR